MNKDKLTSLCHKISKESGLTFNSVMTQYFLETVLHRLANSKYNENLIFKGGFLLSNILGLGTRSTVDIDFLLTKMELSDERIREMLSDALENDSDDKITYEIQGIQKIKGQDQYGGYRVMVICGLQNIKQIVPLDIATGDLVTPDPIDYVYSSTFGLEDITIRAYPIETIMAEKLQTIYIKGFLNSRSKDYYDLHVIYNLKRDKIRIEILMEACKKTFSQRNTEFDLNKIKIFLKDIKNDESFVKRWNGYEKKNPYDKGTKLETAIESILSVIGLMYLE
ncbi:MAG: nucleotidyl transferase AbiEii/AbiGii toxin family protein [Dethiosulfatibacter sp.]|nr:nucleotidyl transferase AbiEii/AbiGii toxin family protein [Dethiosulfatibacter sp.]